MGHLTVVGDGAADRALALRRAVIPPRVTV
jgi:hypothetical protein